jgi:hypothetical protein
MQIPERNKKKIDEIMAHFKCPADFACYKSGFRNLCKASDISVEGFANCLEESVKTRPCRFSLPFGYQYFCRCPLRVYLAKNMHI